MQPAAAEVERETGRVDHSQRTAAETRTGFNKQAANAGIVQSPRRRNAGGSGSNHYDLYVTLPHRLEILCDYMCAMIGLTPRRVCVASTALLWWMICR